MFRVIFFSLEFGTLPWLFTNPPLAWFKASSPVDGTRITRMFDWAVNFWMVDIGIKAYSTLFLNLQINIILQDYLKSVWKTINFKLIFNHLKNCSSQSEKSGQPMREQKYSHYSHCIFYSVCRARLDSFCNKIIFYKLCFLSF